MLQSAEPNDHEYEAAEIGALAIFLRLFFLFVKVWACLWQ